MARVISSGSGGVVVDPVKKRKKRKPDYNPYGEHSNRGASTFDQKPYYRPRKEAVERIAPSGRAGHFDSPDSLDNLTGQTAGLSAEDTNTINMASAFLREYGAYPSALKAYVMLQTAGKEPKSIEDWQQIIKYRGPLKEVSDAVLTPDYIDDPTGGVIRDSITPYRSYSVSYDEYVKANTAFTWGIGGSPWGVDVGAQADLPHVQERQQKLLNLNNIQRRNANNPDFTQLEEDRLFMSLTDWKREHARRAAERGRNVDFDADENVFDQATQAAMLTSTIDGQLAYFYRGNAEQQRKAREVIEWCLTTLDPKNGRSVMAKMDATAQSFSLTGLPEGKMSQQIYDAWIDSRPVSQSVERRRAEYAVAFGVDALPPEEKQILEQQSMSILGLVTEVTAPITEWTKDWQVRIAEKIDPVDTATEAAIKIFGDSGFGHVAEAIHKWNENAIVEYGGKIGYGISKLNQAGSTLVNFIALVDENYVFDDTGELVANPKYESGLFGNAGGDTSIKDGFANLGKLWDASEGQQAVAEFTNLFSQTAFGTERDNSLVNFVADTVNLGVSLYGFGKLDNLMWATGGKAARGAYGASRKIAVRAPIMAHSSKDFLARGYKRAKASRWADQRGFLNLGKGEIPKRDFFDDFENAELGEIMPTQQVLNSAIKRFRRTQSKKDFDNARDALLNHLHANLKEQRDVIDSPDSLPSEVETATRMAEAFEEGIKKVEELHFDAPEPKAKAPAAKRPAAKPKTDRDATTAAVDELEAALTIRQLERDPNELAAAEQRARLREQRDPEYLAKVRDEIIATLKAKRAKGKAVPEEELPEAEAATAARPAGRAVTYEEDPEWDLDQGDDLWDKVDDGDRENASDFTDRTVKVSSAPGVRLRQHFEGEYTTLDEVDARRRAAEAQAKADWEAGEAERAAANQAYIREIEHQDIESIEIDGVVWIKDFYSDYWIPRDAGYKSHSVEHWTLDGKPVAEPQIKDGYFLLPDGTPDTTGRYAWTIDNYWTKDGKRIDDPGFSKDPPLDNSKYVTVNVDGKSTLVEVTQVNDALATPKGSVVELATDEAPAVTRLRGVLENKKSTIKEISEAAREAATEQGLDYDEVRKTVSPRKVLNKGEAIKVAEKIASGEAARKPSWKEPELWDIIDEDIASHPAHAIYRTTMSPDRYLELTADLARKQKLAEGIDPDAISGEMVKATHSGRNGEIAARFKAGQEVDPAYIDIDVETRQTSVYSLQQGDHRALTAKELGIEEMPVVYRLFRMEDGKWRPATRAEAEEFKANTLAPQPKGETPVTPRQIEVVERAEKAVAKVVKAERAIEKAREPKRAPVKRQPAKREKPVEAKPEAAPGPGRVRKEQHPKPEKVPIKRVAEEPEYDPKGGVPENAHELIDQRNSAVCEMSDAAYELGKEFGINVRKLAVEEGIDPRVTTLEEARALLHAVMKKAAADRGTTTGKLVTDAKKAKSRKKVKSEKPEPRQYKTEKPEWQVKVDRDADGTILMTLDNVDDLHAPLPGENDPLLPNDYRKMPFLLRNNIEMLAHGTKAEDYAMISLIWDIPDEFADDVRRIAATDNPQVVKEIIDGLQKKGWVSFDPTMPGIYNMARMKLWKTGGEGFEMWRRMTTPIALNKLVPEKDAHRHVLHLGQALKMGRKEYDAAAQARTQYWVRRMFDAEHNTLARQRVLDAMWDEIEKTMRKEGTWEPYQEFKLKVSKQRARDVSKVFARYYGERDKVVPADYTRSLHARLAADKAELRKLAEKTGESPRSKEEIEAAIADAEKRIMDYERAAKIVNEFGLNKKGEKRALTRSELAAKRRKMSPDEEWAFEYLDNLSYSEPVWGFQHLQTLRHREDPRALTHFQAGKAAQISSILDARVMDKMMRYFKILVMSNLGFAWRTLGGDEATRLISEGLIPGSQRWRDMRAMRTEVMGGKGRLTAAERKEWGELHGHAGRKLAKLTEERDELRGKASLTPAEKARLAELKGKLKRHSELEAKQASKVSPLISDELQEKAPHLGEDFSDEFTLRIPGEQGHAKAFARFCNRLRSEPLVRRALRRKQPFKNADEIRDWVRGEIRAETKRGEKLRAKLVQTHRITAKQAADLAEFRKLLTSDKFTGSANNLAEWIEEQTGIIAHINANPRLSEAMRKGNLTEEIVGRLDAKHLWAVPSNERYLGRFASFWSKNLPLDVVSTAAWFPKFYEKVTMRVLESGTNALRERFFSDALARHYKQIREMAPDVKPEEAMRLAERKAMNYVNKVTFTRNPTIFEDLARNHIPFINSYRQFIQYWLKTTAKHPFAMAASYKLNPINGHLMQSLGSSGLQVLIPPIPFYVPQTEDEMGLGGLVKSSLPSVNPVVGLMFGSLGRSVDIDTSNWPLLSSSSKGMVPLSAATPWLAGFVDIDIPYLTKDPISIERNHANNIKAWATANGEPVPDNIDAKVNYPWYLKPMAWVNERTGGKIMPYPELVLQAVSKQWTPTAMFVKPEISEQILVGSAKFNAAKTPEERAAVRVKYPYYDKWLELQEATTTAEAISLQEKNPWLTNWSASIYDYDGRDGETAGVNNPSRSAFNDDLGTGRVRIKDDLEICKAIIDKQVQMFGGYRYNSTESFPGTVNLAKDTEKLEADKKAAMDWARKWVTKISQHPKTQEELLDRFREATIENGGMPGVFKDIARAEAESMGMTATDYEMSLMPKEIQAQFDAKYHSGDWDKIQPFEVRGPDDDVIDGIVMLEDMGIFPRGKIFADDPAAQAKVDERRYDKTVAERQMIIGMAADPIYTMDSETLRRQGYHVTPAINLALIKLQDYYNGPYRGVISAYYENKDGKHGGYKLDDVKRARQDLFAYKDKLFKDLPGGKAIIGGTLERISNLPYFRNPMLGTVGTGPESLKQQQDFAEFLDLADNPHPTKAEIARLWELQKNLTPPQRERVAEIKRVVHMQFVLATAKMFRDEMKYSYSDYYKGPGYSLKTKLGKQRVERLDAIMKKIIKDEEELSGRSLFGEDVKMYFQDTHYFAYKLLDWQWH